MGKAARVALESERSRTGDVVVDHSTEDKGAK